MSQVSTKTSLSSSFQYELQMKGEGRPKTFNYIKLKTESMFETDWFLAIRHTFSITVNLQILLQI